MYSGTRLIELLEQQHQARNQADLFQKGIFAIQWRAKVGSFPHPDVETIVSAGEPCGAFRPKSGCPHNLSRPEEKRNLGENLKYFPGLPLNGYIPGSAIRGLVRSWAKQRPEIKPRMFQLLGYQDDDKIQSGKIEFLDAWPEKPTQLTLDIVNPQQEFQVYHQGQGTPLSFYTLGNGEKTIPVTVAIRGIPGKTTAAEVAEVWDWVQQAITLYGVGSRTASGYGAIKAKNQGKNQDAPKIIPDPGYTQKEFNFILYSQGSYGADNQPNSSPQLRPTHWRGWLRSWVLRFLLGVMSEQNAQATLAELMGTLEPDSRKGCLRLEMIQGSTWGERSQDSPRFYAWKGKLVLTAPKDTLNQIILPIVQFAVMAGGVGRGWRRPLHIFRTDKGYEAARGTDLTLTHQVKDQNSDRMKLVKYGLGVKPEKWQQTYDKWVQAVQQQWPNRIAIGQNDRQPWEIFSPNTCSVYIVPGPHTNPVNTTEIEWLETYPQRTRGDGVNLIYQETHPQNYKRNSEMGGNAGNGGSSCSWASIKRVNIPNAEAETDCQEIVCLFLGGQNANANHVRSRFLKDLGKMQGGVHLFGIPAPQT